MDLDLLTSAENASSQMTKPANSKSFNINNNNNNNSTFDFNYDDYSSLYFEAIDLCMPLPMSSVSFSNQFNEPILAATSSTANSSATVTTMATPTPANNFLNNSMSKYLNPNHNPDSQRCNSVPVNLFYFNSDNISVSNETAGDDQSDKPNDLLSNLIATHSDDNFQDKTIPPQPPTHPPPQLDCHQSDMEKVKNKCPKSKPSQSDGIDLVSRCCFI
jgi:hypothetical protein